MAILMIVTLVPATLSVAAAGEDLEAGAVHGIRGDYYIPTSGGLPRQSGTPVSADFAQYRGSEIFSDLEISDFNPRFNQVAPGRNAENVSVVFTGRIVFPETGNWRFMYNGDNGVVVRVDGKTVVTNGWVNDWEINYFGANNAYEAGKAYDVEILYFQATGGANFHLYWSKEDTSTNGNASNGYTTVPASAYYLPKDLAVPQITSIDTSSAVLQDGNVSGTINVTGTGFENATFAIANSNGSIASTDVTATAVTATSATLSLPASLKLGGYKVAATVEGATTAITTPVIPSTNGQISVISTKGFSIVGDFARDEYPDPSWERSENWINLNGPWDFKFDGTELSSVGEDQGWHVVGLPNPEQIIVPYPWDSPASAIANEYRGTGWYYRTVDIDAAWAGKSIVMRIGAIDNRADLWVNGEHVNTQANGYPLNELGDYRITGGYIPEYFDLTDFLNVGEENTIAIRVNDEATYGGSYLGLIGKQGRNAPCGYIHTSGIWQTVSLEARESATQLDYAHAVPNIADKKVEFDLALLKPKASGTYTLEYTLESFLYNKETKEDEKTGHDITGSATIDAKTEAQTVSITLGENQKLWDTVTPNLYKVVFILKDGADVKDKVSTEFGQRQFTIENYDGREYKYIYLNGKPLFLSGLLDQGFWLEGNYTAPSKEALEFDVSSMTELGFNMIRKHLKIEDPMQYYYLDRYGMLMWQDMPHASQMTQSSSRVGRQLYEKALRTLIKTNYNHPSLQAYILFNETWGLTGSGSVSNNRTNENLWITEMYNLTHSLDRTKRIVEDMSPCNNDHIQPTDMNTFHMYPGSYSGVKGDVDNRDNNTYVGSSNNMYGNTTANRHYQDGDPFLNSEYGGVGAYAGNHDVSWCFKYQTDVQRLRQKLQGFVYTEPYDIEYERNGILKYDRSMKVFGYDEIAYGGDMTFSDLTQQNYIGIDADPAQRVAPGGTYTGKIGAINWSGESYPGAKIKYRFDAFDIYGNSVAMGIEKTINATYAPYTYETYDIVEKLPAGSKFNRIVGTVTVWIEDASGAKIAKNFSNFKVSGSEPSAVDQMDNGGYALRQKSNTAVSAGNEKVGSKTLTYTVPESVTSITDLRLMTEVAAIKDKSMDRQWTTENANADDIQTAEGYESPSDVTVSINGHEIDTVFIPDAPCDMRSLNSLDSGRASARPFGYLVNVRADAATTALINSEIASNKTITVKYEVKADAENKHGVAIFDDATGRYPLSPTLLINAEEAYVANVTETLTAAGEKEIEIDEDTAEIGNYAVEATISSASEAGFIVRDGYFVSVNGNTVSLKDGETVIASAEVEDLGANPFIKVVLFDTHIQVYANNEVIPVIDVYDDTYASGGAKIKADGAADFVGLLVHYETYGTNSVEPSDYNVQFVESFGVQNSGGANTTFANNYDKYLPSGTTTGVNNTWEVRQEGTNATDRYLYFSSGRGPKAVLKNIKGSNIVMEADITITGRVNSDNNPNAGFLLRVQDARDGVDNCSAYYVGMGVVQGQNRGFLQVGRMSATDGGGTWSEIARVDNISSILYNTTHRLKVVAIGPRIQVFLDDEATPRIDIYDSSYNEGQFGFRAHQAAGKIDNFVVSTAPRYSTDFSPKPVGKGPATLTAAEWQTKGTTSFTNSSLVASGKSTATVGSDAWTDEDVTAKVKIDTSGEAGLILRGIDTPKGLNGYKIGLDAATRKVVVKKVTNDNAVVIGTANYPSLKVGQEYQLRAQMLTNAIAIYVNNINILTLSDNTFKAGKIGLYTESGAATFKDFSSTDKFSFYENWEEGALNYWSQYGGEYSISNNEMTMAPGTGNKIVHGYSTWKDYEVTMDMQILQNGTSTNKANAGLVFRASEFTNGTDNLRGYVAGVNKSPPGTTEPSGLELGDLQYGWRWITAPNIPGVLDFNTWYKVRVKAEGDHIRVWVNDVEDTDTPVVDVHDKAYAYGQFALRNFNAGMKVRQLKINNLEAPFYEAESEIISVEAGENGTAIANEVSTIKVVATDDIKNFKLYNESNLGIILLSKVGVPGEEPGTTEWTLTAKLGSVGKRSFTIVGANGDKEDVATKVFDVNIIATPIEEITPLVKTLVVPETAKVGAEITATITTSSAISNIKLTNESNVGIAKKSQICVDDGTEKTWTIVFAISTKGERTIKLTGSASDNIFKEEYGVKTATITVSK